MSVCYYKMYVYIDSESRRTTTIVIIVGSFPHIVICGRNFHSCDWTCKKFAHK